MKRISKLSRCVPIAIGALACSSSSPSEQTNPDVDPGKPPSEFGTKCYVNLVEESSNTKLTFEDCAVSAGTIEQGSHLFFVFGRLPQGAQRLYVSLVVETTPLTAGAYSRARVGAIEATLEDGRSFSVGDVRKEGALAFIIDSAGTAPDRPTVFYVKGSLETSLQELHNPSSKLLFRAVINKP
jgi:hypothetical protein